MATQVGYLHNTTTNMPILGPVVLEIACDIFTNKTYSFSRNLCSVVRALMKLSLLLFNMATQVSYLPDATLLISFPIRMSGRKEQLANDPLLNTLSSHHQVMIKICNFRPVISSLASY